MILKFDEHEKFRAHATNSLAVALRMKRSGCNCRYRKSGASQSSPAWHTVSGRWAVSLGLSGHELYSMSIGSSDLPAVLENTINKAVSVGYNEAAPSFLAFTKEDETENFNRKKAGVKFQRQ